MNGNQLARFGYILIGIWCVLILIIGIGHVVEATSFGLHDCITALAVISGLWAQAAFHILPVGSHEVTGPTPSPPSAS